MLARDLMTRFPPCVSLNTPASEIIRVMQDQDAAAVMVMAADGSLAGVVSEGDLLRRKDGGHRQGMEPGLGGLAAGAPLSLEFLHFLHLRETTAAALMSSPAIMVDERASLSDIAGLLLKHGIARVPVIRNGGLVGIVSRRDILRALAGEQSSSYFGGENRT